MYLKLNSYIPSKNDACRYLVKLTPLIHSLVSVSYTSIGKYNSSILLVLPIFII